MKFSSLLVGLILTIAMLGIIGILGGIAILFAELIGWWVLVLVLIVLFALLVLNYAMEYEKWRG